MNSNYFYPKLFLLIRKIVSPFFFTRMLARRVFRYAKADVVVEDYDGNIKTSLKLSEHIQRRIFWMGYCSEDVISVLKARVTEGMTVLDVGANIGEITLVAAKLVGIKGRVVSFEPVTSNFNKLKENIDLNSFSNVTLMKKGLGAKAQKNTPIYPSSGNSSSDENHGLASLFNSDESERPIDYISIEKMDNIIHELNLSRIDLIKIDIEGGEMDCLIGAQSTLEKYRPMLIIEVQEHTSQQAGWSSLQLFEYLEKFNYEFFDIKKDGGLIKRDKNNFSKYPNVFCVSKS